MTKKQLLVRKNTVPVFLTGALLLVFLFIVITVALFMVSWFQGMLATPGVVPKAPSSVGPSENVRYQFGQVVPDWMGTKRVTVLLLGIDERAQESGPFRTDTMMVLTLDPATKQAGALSLPRDLWVPIPGYDDGRINTAHFLGDLYGHPGGGPMLALETVEYNLGEPIDYYVRVNFHAFVTIVDLIGGVDIYVEKTINDPTYPDYHYGYDPLYVEPGWHHFDGEMALKYARTRHGSSDFDRARRQQQVMTAVLEQVSNLELLPELARNAPKIYETIETSVHTNLALDQMLALANLATEVDRSQIRFGVIDQTCTQNWTTPDGAQVLVPLRDKMREVRNYVFAVEYPTPVPEQSSNQTPVPTIPAPTMTPEQATVAVLNGTPRAGFAGQTSDYLKTQGFNVTHVGNADHQEYARSLIIMNRDKPLTAARLAELMQLPTASIVHGSEPNADYDIVVVLGDDYVGSP